ncbi:MAG: DEAD/DEAH box helicase [Proteobacteria bacterium]|nr:DEAD/DEAH box helicase [Pseudomonadota bacterium]
MSFENLGLGKGLLKAIKDMGFIEPTPIQKQAIPEIISGDRDMVGLAQTGTGKTAAFGLPLIQLTDFNQHVTTGLVLCPTRELCLQISKDFITYSSHIKGARIVSVYGGASYTTQIRDLKKGAPIIIATPGRLIDLMKRKLVNLSHVSYVVLDEADEMLNMGFLDDIDDILEKTPETKHVWLFSATMPKAVSRIAANYMKQPVEITVGSRNAVAGNIDHIHYLIKEKDRYPALKRIIDYHPGIFGLIFCRTRNETAEVSEKLIDDGYQAEALHGDLSQQRRDAVMRQFRERHIQLLVATDVAARGIDVNNISHIIHFRLPDEAENYTHRSGRTARAGKSGISMSLINIKEKGKLTQIEKKSGIRIRYENVPAGQDILEKHLFATIDRLDHANTNSAEIERFLPVMIKKLASLSKEELIKRVISTECERFLSYYQNAPDINIEKSQSSSKEKGQSFLKKNREDIKKPRLNGVGKRFFINLGEMDKIQKGSITKLVCHYSGIPSNQLGKIEIYRSFSFFEVAPGASDNILSSLKHAKLDGRKVMVEVAGKRIVKNKRAKRKS